MCVPILNNKVNQTEKQLSRKIFELLENIGHCDMKRLENNLDVLHYVNVSVQLSLSVRHF